MSDLYLKGRTSFDKQRYEKNDSLGKRLGYNYLSFVTEKLPNKQILPISEDKKCGDIKLLDTKTGQITYYEIEVRNSKDFDKNFLGIYSTVDIPLKKFEQINQGYYIAFDESEELNFDLPNRMYGIDISLIKQHKPGYKETKFNPGKKELFYKIPKNLVQKYQYNKEEKKYVKY